MRPSWQPILAAITATLAVAVFELTLFRSATYPPGLGLSLAIVGILFLTALALVHQIHISEWTGLARFGFVVSAAGLGLWIVGGTMNESASTGIDSGSHAARFLREVVRGPQAGWGLFCVGLIPIGIAAIRNGLPTPNRLLLPLGSLLFLDVPLKNSLGERAGGLTILATFGLGWLAVGITLFLESRRPLHNAAKRSPSIEID